MNAVGRRACRQGKTGLIRHAGCHEHCKAAEMQPACGAGHALQGLVGCTAAITDNVWQQARGACRQGRTGATWAEGAHASCYNHSTEQRITAGCSCAGNSVWPLQCCWLHAAILDIHFGWPWGALGQQLWIVVMITPDCTSWALWSSSSVPDHSFTVHWSTCKAM